MRAWGGGAAAKARSARICAFGGSRIGSGGSFVLAQQVDAVYAAEIGSKWSVQLDEQSLRERFSLIMAEWTMGDN